MLIILALFFASKTLAQESVGPLSADGGFANLSAILSASSGSAMVFPNLSFPLSPNTNPISGVPSIWTPNGQSGEISPNLNLPNGGGFQPGIPNPANPNGINGVAIPSIPNIIGPGSFNVSTNPLLPNPNPNIQSPNGIPSLPTIICPNISAIPYSPNLPNPNGVPNFPNIPSIPNIPTNPMGPNGGFESQAPIGLCDPFEYPTRNPAGQWKCVPEPRESCIGTRWFVNVGCFVSPCYSFRAKCPQADFCTTHPCNQCRGMFYDQMYNRVCYEVH